jgi:hypothetical protein
MKEALSLILTNTEGTVGVLDDEEKFMGYVSIRSLLSLAEGRRERRVGGGRGRRERKGEERREMRRRR